MRTRMTPRPEPRGALAYILPATAGALAYAVSKVDLASRGELGMPGFPAPPDSYRLHDPLWGQLGNAAAGVMLALLILALAWPPRRGALRRILLGVNWITAVFIAVSVVTFTFRAAGWAPGLGAPAEGVAGWIALGVGYAWVSAWIAALLSVRRRS